MNKRGEIGTMIDMIWFLGAVSTIVVIIFGISATSYGYDISVRDSEARILGVKILDCLAEGGVLDLDEINEEDYDKVFSYCGFGKSERVYIGVEVFGDQGRLEFLSEGDSGLLWVRDLFGKVVEASDFNNDRVESIAEYNPGYFSFERSVFVVEDGDKVGGKVKLEVLINHEK